MLLSFILLFIYFAVVGYGLNLCGVRELYQRATKTDVVCFISISLFFILLTISIIARENCVYYWDYGAYWHASNTLSEQLQNDTTRNILHLLKNSINTDEYNILPCLIIAVPLKFLGGSYLAFVLVNFVLFYLPCSIFNSLILNKLFGGVK